MINTEEIIKSLKNGDYEINEEIYGVGFTADPDDNLMRFCDEEDPDSWFYQIVFYVSEPSFKSSGACVDITIEVCGHTFQTSVYGIIDEYLEWTTTSDVDFDDELVKALNAVVYVPEEYIEWFNAAFPNAEVLLEEIEELEDITPKEYLTDGFSVYFRKKKGLKVPKCLKLIESDALYKIIKKNI